MRAPKQMLMSSSVWTQRDIRPPPTRRPFLRSRDNPILSAPMKKQGFNDFNALPGSEGLRLRTQLQARPVKLHSSVRVEKSNKSFDAPHSCKQNEEAQVMLTVTNGEWAFPRLYGSNCYNSK